MDSSRPPPKSSGSGLSYHDPSYWQNRFSTDPREATGFEWLSSSTSLVSLIPRSLLLRTPPARILHIGVGTSRLSLDLLRYYKENAPQDWKERAKQIVNVDFSEKSIEFQRQAETAWLEELGEEGEMELMENHVLDLLDHREVDRVLGSGGRRFDVVLDKSTTDSISTGEDTPFDQITEARHHGSLVKLARARDGKKGGVATPQILGVNLAGVVERDGTWLCHSYSSIRWEDIILGKDAWPWEQTSKRPVPVESSDPNAPQINHWIYTLHRT